MALLIFAALIAVPLLEIALFILLGQEIGILATVGMVILTAVIGTALLRWQGLQAVERARLQIARGDMPLEEVITGVFLVVAGALLLTPGFLTDGIGFALLIPPIRKRLGSAAFRWLTRHGTIHVAQAGFAQPRSAPDIMEGEFEPVDPPNDDPRTPDNSSSGGGSQSPSRSAGGSPWRG